MSAARLEAVRNELRTGGADVAIHCIDITDDTALAVAFAAIVRGDALVNSAGIEGPTGPLETCDLDAVDRLLAVDLRGGLACAQHAIRHMKAAGQGGAVVNVASAAGLLASRRLGAYALSNAAVISMTRSLPLSLAGDGIRVNAVRPVSKDSEMFDRTLASADPEAQRRALIALHPLGRLGQPVEVAEAIAFLASPAAAYLTGVSLPIDAGRLA